MSHSDPAREVAIGVIVGRLLLLAVATAAFVVGVVHGHGGGHVARAAPARYVCPMHPQVVASAPGDCPICNMALERVREAQATGAPASVAVTLDEAKRKVITQVVRAPAWLGADGDVTAMLPRESLQGLAPGHPASFFRGSEPATAIPIRLSSEPVAPWDAATVQARFRSKQRPRAAADTGWLVLDAEAQELVVVPASSVLYSGTGAYVLAVPAGGGTPERRPIQVGRILDSGYVADLDLERLGAVVVLSGLDEGERVVTARSFFEDAERRLQAARGSAQEVVE